MQGARPRDASKIGPMVTNFIFKQETGNGWFRNVSKTDCAADTHRGAFQALYCSLVHTATRANVISAQDINQ